MEILLKEAQVSGLPHALHQGKTLTLKTINYFFGPNGSGKSLVLKIVAKQAKQAIISSGRNHDGYFAQYITASPQHNLYQESQSILDKSASQSDLDSDEVTGQTFYQHLEDYPEIRIKIRDALQKYLGRYPNLQKRGVNNVMGFLRENDDEIPSYSPQHESDGLRRLSLLLTYVYHPKCLFLAMDEPELYLHPDMISFLLEEIHAEMRFGKQFAFATHNPEMIRVGKSDTYTYSYFNLKARLRDTHIIQANEKGADVLIEKLGPFLDANKRAFLYAPVTLFVEGMSDEIIFAKLKTDGKVDWSRRVFMVNTGGNNMTYQFWKLWRSFDKEARVILDAPKSGHEKSFTDEILFPFCDDLGIDKDLSLTDQKAKLEEHNIYVAEYEDVLHFSGTFLDSAQDYLNAPDKFDVSKHILVLQKAVSVVEPKKKVLRSEEENWLNELATRVHSRLYNSSDAGQTVDEIVRVLQAEHPTLEISKPDPSTSTHLLDFKFRVSANRYLVLKVSDKVSETKYDVE